MVLRFKAFAPLLPLVAIMAFVNVSSPVAQERTAGSTVETQMTWTALVNQINALKSTVILTNNRMDAGVACGKKGMVYAPGESADGCVEANISGNKTVNMTYLSNSLTTTANNLATTTTNVNKIVACNQQGKLYNGSTCADITNNNTQNSANCSTTSTVSSNGSCPAGAASVSSAATCHQGSGGRGGYDVACTKVTCLVTTCK